MLRKFVRITLRIHICLQGYKYIYIFYPLRFKHTHICHPAVRLRHGFARELVKRLGTSCKSAVIQKRLSPSLALLFRLHWAAVQLLRSPLPVSLPTTTIKVFFLLSCQLPHRIPLIIKRDRLLLLFAVTSSLMCITVCVLHWSGKKERKG